MRQITVSYNSNNNNSYLMAIILLWVISKSKEQSSARVLLFVHPDDYSGSSSHIANSNIRNNSKSFFCL